MADEFNLGLNSGSITYFEEGFPFKDLMKNGEFFRIQSVTIDSVAYNNYYFVPSSFPDYYYDSPRTDRIDSGEYSDENGYNASGRFWTGSTSPYKRLVTSESSHFSAVFPFSSTLYDEQAIFHVYYEGDTPSITAKPNPTNKNFSTPTLVSSTAGELCYALSSAYEHDGVVHPFESIQIALSGTSTYPNHTRNVRVVHQKYKDDYETNPFVSNLINLFTSATTSGGPFRVLDWAKTNNSPVSSTSQLVTKTMHAQGFRYGAAWEYICEFANTVDRPLWVTVPHLADRACLSAIASSISGTLDSDKEVYVEYSNETWNGTFDQTDYLNDTANNSPLSATYELPFPETTNPDTLSRSRGRGLGMLSSLQVFDVFENYFPPDRLTRVVAHQKTGTIDQFMKGMLLYENAYSSVDMWAIAPYAGNFLGNDLRATSSVSGWTKDQVFDFIYETVSGPYPQGVAPSGHNADAISGVPHLLSSTETYNGTALGDLFSAISPGCYESGQHLNVRKSAVTNADGDAQREIVFNTIANLFSSCQDDPRMGDWYEFYYNYLKDNGFKTVCGFVDVGGWGISYTLGNADFWGLIPYYGYSPQPKLDGALAFIDSITVSPPTPDPVEVKVQQIGYRIDVNVSITVTPQ